MNSPADGASSPSAGALSRAWSEGYKAGMDAGFGIANEGYAPMPENPYRDCQGIRRGAR